MKKEKIIEAIFLLIGAGLFGFIFYFAAAFGWAIIRSVFG
jgi:hypothetical protein